MDRIDDDLIIDIDIPDDEGGDGKAGKGEEHAGSAELRAQLERMQGQLRDKDTALATARQEVDRVRHAATDSQVEAVGNAIAAEEAARDHAKREFAAAQAEGDWDKAADAQEKLTAAVTKLTRLAEDKADLEERAKSGARPSTGDSVEDYINQFSPRAQSWLREHKECVTDKKLNLRMIAAHNEALAEDIAGDSDKYFAFLEQKLGLGTDDTRAEDPPQRDPPARRAAPDIQAPVSRTPPDSRGRQDASRMTLTRAEVDMADSLGISRVEYAKNKRDAEKAGLIGTGR